MWEGGRNNSAFQAMAMNGIHVLLVDHDPQALIYTAKQLEMCHYKVTFVEHASAAIALLPNTAGKAKFDVVMANINSPDLHGLKLLQHALYICIPVILMSDDDEPFMAMRALEYGAFLYMKKPLSMEFVKCLWQHVLREKTRMVREREMLVESNNLGPVRGVEFREAVHPRTENPNPNTIPNPHTSPNLNPNPNPNMMKNKGKYKSKSRGRNVDYDEEYDSESQSQKGNLRRKMCTEWTQELHAKFMNAVEQLGEGRCFPKEILEMMNEPGLTRMQVASHLQKCRNDNWRAPEERRSTHQATQHASGSSGSGSQPKPRRFGSKPIVNTSFSGQSSETLSQTQAPNNGAKMGNGSMMTNNTPHHYRANTSSNPRHVPEDYFNFLNMECLGRDVADRQQGPETGNPGRAYNNEQNNSGETSSTQSKSLWSSDTSNLDSDHSETKAQD